MKERRLKLLTLLAQFLRWWSAELNACAADLMGVVAPRWRRPVIVYLDANRLLIRIEDSANAPTIVEILREHFRSPLPDSLPDPLPSLFDRGRRARLVMATDHAFVCQCPLPLAAVPHLKGAIALQLSKLLPMQSSQLITDFEIAEIDPTKGIVHIELAALKRVDVEQIVKSMQTWGLRVASIHLADAPDSRERFRFENADARGREWGIRRADRVLIRTAAALGLAFVGVAMAQTYRSRQSLEYAASQTSTSAAAALSERQVLLARLEPLAALSQIDRAPGAAAVLAEVTKLVPHDAWLTTFELKDRRLRLVGISPDPAAIVKLLSSSELLSDVELRSAMSAGIGTGKDRFELTAESKSAGP
jgi:hypothetical protein